MARLLIVGILLVSAGASRSLGSQALTSRAAPATALDPYVSLSLREQLSAGFAQRREPSGVLQPFTTDRRMVRQVPVVPDSIPPLLQGAGATRCPMPVAKADARTMAPMPVVRADSSRLERMPVARPTCVNPLDSR